jgi:hypothetical protein
MESLLAFSYHNDGFLEVLSKLLGIDNDSNAISENKTPENPHITMYRYVGEKKLKYEKAIYYFLYLKKSIIPIAIYRMRNDPELKNKMPYIITNPEKNFMLNRYDKIICIGEASKAERFNNFSENEFSNSQKAEDESYSDSSFDVRKMWLKPSRRAGVDNNIFNSSKKNIVTKQEEYENLNEEELLEKLRIEISNLKYFSQVNTINSANFGNLNKNIFNRKNDFNNNNNNFDNDFNESEQKNNLDNENDLSVNENQPAFINNNNNKLKKNYFSKEMNNIIEENVEENEDLNLHIKEKPLNDSNLHKNKSSVKKMDYSNQAKISNNKYLLDKENPQEDVDSEGKAEEALISRKNILKKNSKKRNSINLEKFMRSKYFSQNEIMKLNLTKQFDNKGYNDKVNKSALIIKNINTNNKDDITNSVSNSFNSKKISANSNINNSNSKEEEEHRYPRIYENKKQNEESLLWENNYKISQISRFVSSNKNKNAEELSNKPNIINETKEHTIIKKSSKNTSAKNASINDGSINLIKKLSNENDYIDDKFFCLEKSDYFEDEKDDIKLKGQIKFDNKKSENKIINQQKNNKKKLSRVKSISKNIENDLVRNENGNSINNNYLSKVLNDQEKENNAIRKLE